MRFHQACQIQLRRDWFDRNGSKSRPQGFALPRVAFQFSGNIGLGRKIGGNLHPAFRIQCIIHISMQLGLVDRPGGHHFTLRNLNGCAG